MAFGWRGDEVAEKVIAASVLAVDQTTAATVKHAKENHRWSNRTGTLEGSLQMRPAEQIGTKIVGHWGSFTVAYAIYLELRPEYAWLRLAADAEYPNLASRIKAALE